MPSEIANDAASEKLSTVVIDITVDARQRLRAFNMEEMGLVLSEGVCGTKRVIKGRSEITMKVKGQAIARLSMKMGACTRVNKRAPRKCVTIMMLRVLSTGLCLLDHFVVGAPFGALDTSTR